MMLYLYILLFLTNFLCYFVLYRFIFRDKPKYNWSVPVFAILYAVLLTAFHNYDIRFLCLIAYFFPLYVL